MITYFLVPTLRVGTSPNALALSFMRLNIDKKQFCDTSHLHIT